MLGAFRNAACLRAVVICPPEDEVTSSDLAPSSDSPDVRVGAWGQGTGARRRVIALGETPPSGFPCRWAPLPLPFSRRNSAPECSCSACSADDLVRQSECDLRACRSRRDGSARRLRRRFRRTRPPASQPSGLPPADQFLEVEREARLGLGPADLFDDDSAAVAPDSAQRRFEMDLPCSEVEVAPAPRPQAVVAGYFRPQREHRARPRTATSRTSTSPPSSSTSSLALPTDQPTNRGNESRRRATVSARVGTSLGTVASHTQHPGAGASHLFPRSRPPTTGYAAELRCSVTHRNVRSSQTARRRSVRRRRWIDRGSRHRRK